MSMNFFNEATKICILILVVCLLQCNAENKAITEKKHSFSAVKQHGGRRRYTAPILFYQNHCATFNITLSGDIETNPGPGTCTIFQKTVRKNSTQFRCSTCKDSLHAKCLKKNFVNTNSQQKVKQWTCRLCLCAELPFHGTRSINGQLSAPDSQPTTTIMVDDPQADQHINTLNANNDRISIAHLNTQSITSSFAEFEAMLMRYKFDIITLSETWLKNNPLLLNHVTIPGFKNEFNNSCLLYTSPSPRDATLSRMPSSA